MNQSFIVKIFLVNILLRGIMLSCLTGRQQHLSKFSSSKSLITPFIKFRTVYTFAPYGKHTKQWSMLLCVRTYSNLPTCILRVNTYVTTCCLLLIEFRANGNWGYNIPVHLGLSLRKSQSNNYHVNLHSTSKLYYALCASPYVCIV